MSQSIPQLLLENLQKIEPSGTFTGSLPRIQASSGKQYFGKVGSASEGEQYLGEAESLRCIEKAAPGLSPAVIDTGVDAGGHPYFLSEYKDLSRLTDKAGEILGKRLATELHRFKSEKGYGFEVPTYCGATRLANGWFDNWEECFSTMIGDLLKQLQKTGRYNDLCRKGDAVRERFVDLIRS